MYVIIYEQKIYYIYNTGFCKIYIVCRPVAQSQTEAQFIYPCYLSNIFDCFTEGSFLFPFESYISKTTVATKQFNNINPYLLKDSYKGLTTTELANILKDNCQLINDVTIPPNQIFGGDLPSNNIYSFQTLAYLDSPYNIDKKFKIARGDCIYTPTLQIECPDPSDDEIDFAKDFLNEWLTDYIEYMLDYIDEYKNNNDNSLSLQFWTPRTAEDLLKEASAADIFLLVIAFSLMIVFASVSSVKLCPVNFFHQRMETSTFGTILVVLAVTTGLGFTSLIKLKLSPATIQVLPFIALGFGVDDMYVFLYNIPFVLCKILYNNIVCI